MKDWNAPEVLYEDAVASVKLTCVIVGIYFWEFVCSLDFDFEYFRGKRKFKWPIAFYFLNRYIALFAAIALIVSQALPFSTDCAAWYAFLSVFIQVSANMCQGLASINLSIRTMAIWNRQKAIVIPLCMLIFGHWTIIILSLSTRRSACELNFSNEVRGFYLTFFVYSMLFDFIVLTLSAIKLTQFSDSLLPSFSLPHVNVPFPHLANAGSEGGRVGREDDSLQDSQDGMSNSKNYRNSKLAQLLFRDGLVYFIAAVLSNVVATVFGFLNLNMILSLMCSVPSVISCTIAATRAVRNLARYRLPGLEFFDTSSLHMTTPISPIIDPLSSSPSPRNSHYRDEKEEGSLGSEGYHDDNMRKGKDEDKGSRKEFGDFDFEDVDIQLNRLDK
ncbi:hypothetical protein ABKN59_006260 [Abortiporus biennis]